MDQEEILPDENQIPEQEYAEEQYQEEPAVTVAPPVEGAFSKYLREYRLLNSLLVSLLMLTVIMASIWGMMMGLELAGEEILTFRMEEPHIRSKTRETKSG